MNGNEEKPWRGAVVSWWRRLHPDDEQARHGDRAAAARLRRASDTLEVMVEPEAIRLYSAVAEALGRQALTKREAAGVAIVAGLLAGVRPGARADCTHLAAMLGRQEGERPLFSPLRFMALVRAEEPEERLRHLRRAVTLARNRGFDVGRFAEDMIWWTDETRRRWIFEYHQRGRSAPGATDTEKTEGTVQ